MMFMLTRYSVALACWILWMIPFFRKAAEPRQNPVARDSSARWGMILEAISYLLLWAVPATDVPWWRIALALVFAVIGIVTAWLAVSHLGKQWRVDAALNADHALVRSGPYTIVRHPIYASMFAMLLASGFMLTQWPLIVVGIAIFVAG